MGILSSPVLLQRLLRALGAVAVLAVLAPRGVLLSASPSTNLGDCTVVLTQARPAAPQQTTQRPPVEQAPANPPKTLPSEALRPPQDGELTDLGGVLKAMANADTAPATLAGLQAGKPFSLERYVVLVADVRSIVVLLDARELRARLNASKDVNAETRAAINQNVSVIEGCAPSRFENRGGSAVFEQVTALVQKHRAQLQPFAFQAATPQDSAPVTAPPRKQGQ